MNGNDEMENRDFVGEIVDEYMAVYNTLDPQQKMEADIQRAFRLITLCADAGPLSPEGHLRFADWFIQCGDMKYVEEAFSRYLDSQMHSESV